ESAAVRRLTVDVVVEACQPGAQPVAAPEVVRDGGAVQRGGVVPTVVAMQEPVTGVGEGDQAGRLGGSAGGPAAVVVDGAGIVGGERVRVVGVVGPVAELGGGVAHGVAAPLRRRASMAERTVAVTPAGVWPPTAWPAPPSTSSTRGRGSSPVAMWRARFQAARL